MFEIGFLLALYSILMIFSMLKYENNLIVFIYCVWNLLQLLYCYFLDFIEFDAQEYDYYVRDYIYLIQ